MSKTMDIHIDRSLTYTADGWAERHEVYIQLHHDLLDSGLLATLEGNALKVFLALALQATILTCGNFFDYLAEQGLVTEADLGKVICYQSQETLAKQAGVSRPTVQSQLARLEQEYSLVTRHIQRRSQDGRYTRPVFFIHAEHFVSAPHRAQKLPMVDGEGKPDHVKKLYTVGDEEPDHVKKLYTVNDEESDHVKKLYTDRVKPFDSSIAVAAVDTGNTKQQQQQAKPADKKLTTGQAVFAVFAEALGRPYQPTARDRQYLRELLANGHTVQTICALLPGIVARAHARGTKPRTFGYCVPALQEQELPPLSVSPAALELPAEIRHDLAALGWSGAPDEVARHYHLDPDRVTALLEHWLHHQDQTIRSRAALFRTDLRAGNWPPAAATAGDADDGQRYIQGQYAAYIQH